MEYETVDHSSHRRALGTTPKNIYKRMEDIGIKTRILELQKTSSCHLRSLVDTEPQEL